MYLIHIIGNTTTIIDCSNHIAECFIGYLHCMKLRHVYRYVIQKQNLGLLFQIHSNVWHCCQNVWLIPFIAVRLVSAIYTTQIFSPIWSCEWTKNCMVWWTATLLSDFTECSILLLHIFSFPDRTANSAPISSVQISSNAIFLLGIKELIRWTYFYTMIPECRREKRQGQRGAFSRL